MYRLPAIRPATQEGARPRTTESSVSASPVKYVTAVRAASPAASLRSPYTSPIGDPYTFAPGRDIIGTPSRNATPSSRKGGRKALTATARAGAESRADKYRVYTEQEEIQFGGFDKNPDPCPLAKGTLYNKRHDVNCSVCRGDKRLRVTRRRMAVREKEFAFRMEILQEEGLRRSQLEHLCEEERIEVEARMRWRIAHEQRLAEWEAGREQARHDVLSSEKYQRGLIERSEAEVWRDFQVQQHEWARQTQHLLRVIRGCDKDSAERKDRAHRDMLDRMDKELIEAQSRRLKAFSKEEEQQRRSVASQEEHSRGVLFRLMKQVTQRLELAQILLKQRQADWEKQKIAAQRAVEGDEAAQRGAFMADRMQYLDELAQEAATEMKVLVTIQRQRAKEHALACDKILDEESLARDKHVEEMLGFFTSSRAAKIKDAQRIEVIIQRRKMRQQQEAFELQMMKEMEFESAQAERRRRARERREAKQRTAEAKREAARLAQEAWEAHQQRFDGLYGEEAWGREDLTEAENGGWLSLMLLFDEEVAEVSPEYLATLEMVRTEEARRAGIDEDETSARGKLDEYYEEMVAEHAAELRLERDQEAMQAALDADKGGWVEDGEPDSDDELDSLLGDIGGKDAAGVGAAKKKQPPKEDNSPSIDPSGDPRTAMHLSYANAWTFDDGSIQVFPQAWVRYGGADGDELRYATMQVRVEITKNLQEGDSLFFDSEDFAFEDDGFYDPRGRILAPITTTHGSVTADFSHERCPLTWETAERALKAIRFTSTRSRPPQKTDEFHRMVRLTLSIDYLPLDVRGGTRDVPAYKNSVQLPMLTWPQLLTPLSTSNTRTGHVDGCTAMLLVLGRAASTMSKEEHLARGLFGFATVPFPPHHKLKLSVTYRPFEQYQHIIHDTLDISDMRGTTAAFEDGDCLGLDARASSPVDVNSRIVTVRRTNKVAAVTRGAVDVDAEEEQEEAMEIKFAQPDALSIDKVVQSLVYKRQEPKGDVFMRAIRVQVEVTRKARVVAVGAITVVVDIHNAAKGSLVMSPRPATDYRLASCGDLSTAMQHHAVLPRLLLFPNTRLRTRHQGNLERGYIRVSGITRHDTLSFKPAWTFEVEPLGETAEENDILVKLKHRRARDVQLSTSGIDELAPREVIRKVVNRRGEIRAVCIHAETSMTVEFLADQVDNALIEALVENLLFSCQPKRYWKGQLGTRHIQLSVNVGTDVATGQRNLVMSTPLTVAPPIFAVSETTLSYREGSGNALIGGCVDWVSSQGKFDDLGNGAFFEVTIVGGWEPEDGLGFKGIPLDKLALDTQDVMWQGQMLGRVTLADDRRSLVVEFNAKVAQIDDELYSTDPEHEHIFQNPVRSTRCNVGGWVTRVDPHVRHMMKHVQFSHSSKNPANVEKLIRVAVADGVRGLSVGYAEVNVIPVHDMTEVKVSETLLQYRPAQGGRVLLLFPNVTVSDPDTENFQKGYLSIEIVTGGDACDMVEFLSLAQQEQRYRMDGVIETSMYVPVGHAYREYDNPGSVDVSGDDAVTALQEELLWLTVLGNTVYVNNVPIAQVTTKGSGVKGTCPTFWMIEFKSKCPVPLEVVRYMLSCFWYESTASKVQPGRRLIRLKLNALDETPPPPDTRVKLEVDVLPPHLSCPPFTKSWNYKEGSGMRAINPHIVTPLPKGDVVKPGSSLTCSLRDSEDPGDHIGFIMTSKDGYFEETEAFELLYHRKVTARSGRGVHAAPGTTPVDGELVGHISERERTNIVIECSDACTGEHIALLVTHLGYENTSNAPAQGARDLEIVYYEPDVDAADVESLRMPSSRGKRGKKGGASKTDLFASPSASPRSRGAGSPRASVIPPLDTANTPRSTAPVSPRRALPFKDDAAPAPDRRLSMGAPLPQATNSMRRIPALTRTVQGGGLAGVASAPSSTIAVQINVQPEDDPTEVKLTSESLQYLLGTKPVHIARECEVSDPDTDIFDGTPPQHGLMISFLGAPSANDALNIVPYEGSTIAVEEHDGEIFVYHARRSVGMVPQSKTYGLGKNQLRIALKNITTDALQELLRCVAYENVGTTLRDTGSKCVCITIQDEKAKGPSKSKINIEVMQPFIDASRCKGGHHFLSLCDMRVPGLSFVTLKIECMAVTFADGDAATEPDILPWPSYAELETQCNKLFKVKRGTDILHGIPPKLVGSTVKTKTSLAVTFHKFPGADTSLLQTVVRSCKLKVADSDAALPCMRVALTLSRKLDENDPGVSQTAYVDLKGEWWRREEPPPARSPEERPVAKRQLPRMTSNRMMRSKPQDKGSKVQK